MALFVVRPLLAAFLVGPLLSGLIVPRSAAVPLSLPRHKHDHGKTVDMTRPRNEIPSLPRRSQPKVKADSMKREDEFSGMLEQNELDVGYSGDCSECSGSAPEHSGPGESLVKMSEMMTNKLADPGLEDVWRGYWMKWKPRADRTWLGWRLYPLDKKRMPKHGGPRPKSPPKSKMIASSKDETGE